MRPVTIRLRCRSETLTTLAFPTSVPGLAIHAAQRGGSCPADTWRITHVRSGLAVACCLGSPEAALALAVELGRLADWTASAQTLRDSVLGTAVGDLLARYDATLHGRISTDPADAADLNPVEVPR